MILKNASATTLLLGVLAGSHAATQLMIQSAHAASTGDADPGPVGKGKDAPRLKVETPVAATASAFRSQIPELGPNDFEKIHHLIKPKAGEARWADIPWLTDLVEAWEKAAADGKPLLVWHISGHPLGNC